METAAVLNLHSLTLGEKVWSSWGAREGVLGSSASSPGGAPLAPPGGVWGMPKPFMESMWERYDLCARTAGSGQNPSRKRISVRFRDIFKHSDRSMDNRYFLTHESQSDKFKIWTDVRLHIVAFRFSSI